MQWYVFEKLDFARGYHGRSFGLFRLFKLSLSSVYKTLCYVGCINSATAADIFNAILIVL